MVRQLLDKTAQETSLETVRQELLQAAEQWQVTFDWIKDSVWLIDNNDRIYKCNHSSEEFLKLSKSQIIGRHCWELVHKSAEAIVPCPLIEMKKNRRRETEEKLFGEKYMQIIIDPIFDSNGALAGAVHIMSDITERKAAEKALFESEQKFRSYIERAPDGVFMVDDTGRYLDVNNAAIRITGFSREEFLTMSIRDLVADESSEDGMAHFKKLMETGAAVSDLWHKHKDGSNDA